MNNMSGRPFFFDENIFDEDSPDFYDKKLNQEQQPQYTESDAQTIKQQAYAEGRKAGQQEAEQGIKRQAETLLQSINRDIATLFDAEIKRIELFENEAIHLSLTIFKKLFPTLADEFGTKEIENSIKTALSDYKMPEQIKLEIAPGMSEPLNELIKSLETQFDKTIKLSENANLSAMEYRFLWPEGGIISNRSLIAQKTIEIMQEALAERGINVHDEDTTETQNNDETVEEQTDG